jgi:hypothetical protein
MTVYVCSEKDIECGDRPQNWCLACPRRGLLQVAVAPHAAAHNGPTAMRPATPEEHRWLTSAARRASTVIPHPAEAMAAEYQAWIDFYHAGNGDFADFLRKRLAPKDDVAAVQASSCEWREEDQWGPMAGTYESACGEAWAFTDGGPTENNVRFCQGCGKPVKLVPFSQPVDEDDTAGVLGTLNEQQENRDAG